ncbi:Transcriptional regulator BlaI [compost metagenome]
MSPFDTEGSAFHPGRPGLRKLLGDLEADIMQAVWERGDAAITVREIHEALEASRKIAYTTVMTVMGNLARKGLLQAEKSGKAHLYRATETYEQFTERAVGRIVEELMKDFSAPAIAHFARAVNQPRS